MERNTEPGWRFSNGSGGFVNDTSGRSGHLFTMPYPVSSMDFLVSYKADPSSHYRDDANAYEIYLIDTEGKREPVCKDESGELSCWHPIPLASRKTPPKIHAHRISALASQNKAFCIVTNVYDGIEGVQAGDVKWLRINEVVPRYWATRKIDWSPRITSTNWAGAAWARVQWGVVPVEDDGSASFYVPADRNIFLQALDKDFREIQRERTYVNYRPGEVRSCIGCHTRGGNAPPKIAASAVKALLRPPSELQAQPCDDGQPNQVIHYPSDIQPIFDAKCVSCHGASSPSGGLSLVGTVTTKFSVSYEALLNTFSSYGEVPNQRLAGRLISEIYQHEIVEGTYLPAKSLGSYTSPMMARLLDPADTDHYGVLSENELMILSRWVDSNYQFYGTYYGRHHSDYSANPDFRREPTFEEAIEKYNKPDWHD
jgi:mono/diheme cytochrome c family protein